MGDTTTPSIKLDARQSLEEPTLTQLHSVIAAIRNGADKLGEGSDYNTEFHPMLIGSWLPDPEVSPQSDITIYRLLQALFVSISHLQFGFRAFIGLLNKHIGINGSRPILLIVAFQRYCAASLNYCEGDGVTSSKRSVNAAMAESIAALLATVLFLYPAQFRVAVSRIHADLHGMS